ncbi:semaphorin 5 [Fistulifera solaris]|uniref:Semaphorin 5 n=1 Tax=Fistulifera solaris TaxID=1519565 RepID=A0A1Z5KFL2_FISSO|nr:semaphorin 5 [Fistulifera solaris]|eukprot:GAX24861.1 semaphorin 5 [Fistulifera solaris]
MKGSFLFHSLLLTRILSLSPAWAQETDALSNWSEWEVITPCCEGFQTKFRTCLAEDACVGPSELNFTCSPDDESCGNGGWSAWENSTVCCEQVQVQTRTCLNETCEGSSAQVVACSREDVCYSASTTLCTVVDPFFSSEDTLYETLEECCAAEFSASNNTCLPVDEDDVVDEGDNWSDWNDYTPCCNNRQSRNRTCTDPNGIGCDGLALEEINCSPNTCNIVIVVDGWSDFSDWTECCNGTQSRFRTCNNSEAESNVIIECDGEATENQTCFPDTCISVVDGNWSEWGDWSECCYGVQSRNRTCDNPLPAAGGEDCQGEALEQTTCTPDTCRETAVIANWSEWSEWGPCCNGTQQRFRECEFLFPSNFSDESSCEGPSMEEETCTVDTCNNTTTNNSGWGEFGDWSVCCFGMQNRVRACETPPCNGPFFEEQECTRDDGLEQCFFPISSTRRCEVVDNIEVLSTAQSFYEKMDICCESHFPTTYDACMALNVSTTEVTWGNWTDWNDCCFGKQSRYRTCLNAPCDGSPLEERSCAPDACGLDDPFSDTDTTSGGAPLLLPRGGKRFLILALLLMRCWN